jgi:hypothetical protein
MGDKRTHKPDKDSKNQKESREFAREQRDESPIDQSTRHRSAESVEKGGDNEQKGEPSRHGQATHKGPVPLINK